MPKLCENGCPEYTVGRIIIVDGPKMIRYHLCSQCRKKMLRKRDANDYPSPSTATPDDRDSSSENMG